MKKLALATLLSMVIATPVSAASYTVSKDDTLFKVSQRFGVSIAEIKNANKLTSDTIKTGQVLTIPTNKLAANSGSSLKNTSQHGTTSRYVAANTTKRSSIVSSGSVKPSVLHTKVPVATVSADRTQSSSRSEDRTLDPSQMNAVITNLLGVPYKWGGTTPEGFDCSGFTSYVYNAIGINLPRTSQMQFDAGQSVEDGDLKPGDLLFFDSEKKGTITHVGIYIGDNQMVHAASKNVRIDNLDWYFKNYEYYGAKRFF
jgi:peptidoglycan endopeptidase LytE